MDDREFEVDHQADDAGANSVAAFGAAVSSAENLATIDEAEASKLTGLSGPTLRQLVEVGSIDGQRGEDGSYSFEFRSIRALVPLDDREAMGASYESRRNGGAFFDSAGREAVGDSRGSGLERFGDADDCLDDGACEEVCNEVYKKVGNEEGIEVLSGAAGIEADCNDNQGVASVESDSQVAFNQSKNHNSSEIISNINPATNSPKAHVEDAQAGNVNLSNHITPTQGNDSRSAELNDLEARLLKVLRWQDNIIAVKDEQIAALQSEISWLRLRVEKFEDQSDRDRVLLMSQNQTIQQLAKLDRNKRSLMRSTMEFLGLVPKEEVRTLE